MEWLNGPLLGFDLETTGTDPYKCSSVDIALVLDDPSQNDHIEWEWLVNPGIDIPLEATAIHGISTEHVEEKGMPIQEAIGEMLAVLSTIEEAYTELPPVCIYNAAFDIPIILRESGGRIGHLWSVLDPMVIDKELDTYRPGKRTLTAVSAAYGLAVKNAHRAIGDTLSTIRLMRAIGKRYPRLSEKDPKVIHAMEVRAYREQMEQFINYHRINGNEGFTCNTQWPYDENIPYGISGSAPVMDDYYMR